MTKKPAETRMGSGKGAPDHWVAVVLPGRMLLEIGGIREDQAKEALTIAGHKFPMGTKIVTRVFAEGETIELGKKAELRAQMAAEARSVQDDDAGEPPAEEGAADRPRLKKARSGAQRRTRVRRCELTRFARFSDQDLDRAAQ